MKQSDIFLTDKLRKELEALKQREIDLTDDDAPEILIWEKAVHGKFYRPLKKQITIRIDADILEWFKHVATKYQPLINQACREYMRHHKNLSLQTKKNHPNTK